MTALADTSGTVVERYRYLPYGTPTVLDANWTNDADGASDVGWSHLHQGGRLDATTALYHFRHRDYSHAAGRWAQQDPLGYVDGLGLYEHVTSNPGNLRDPSGLVVYRCQPWQNLRTMSKVTLSFVSGCDYCEVTTTIRFKGKRCFIEGVAMGDDSNPNNFLTIIRIEYTFEAFTCNGVDYPKRTEVSVGRGFGPPGKLLWPNMKNAANSMAVPQGVSQLPSLVEDFFSAAAAEPTPPPSGAPKPPPAGAPKPPPGGGAPPP